jgi:hypothetical protein
MERDVNKVNVISPDFGGVGPRQCLGEAMKDVEHFSQIIVIGLNEEGETQIYASEMRNAELALISARLQGYALAVVNDWEDSGD